MPWVTLSLKSSPWLPQMSRGRNDSPGKSSIDKGRAILQAYGSCFKKVSLGGSSPEHFPETRVSIDNVPVRRAHSLLLQVTRSWRQGSVSVSPRQNKPCLMCLSESPQLGASGVSLSLGPGIGSPETQSPMSTLS